MTTIYPRVEHMKGTIREGGDILRAQMQATEIRLLSEMQAMEARLRAEMNNHQNRVTQMWIGTMGTMITGFIALGVAIVLST